MPSKDTPCLSRGELPPCDLAWRDRARPTAGLLEATCAEKPIQVDRRVTWVT